MGQQSSSNEAISLNIVSDPIQAKIFSNISIFELIQTMTVLSKQYNQLINNDTIIWKQLSVKTLEISTTNSYIKIHDHSFKNPPEHFLLKLKLIPLNLDTIEINAILKPWCQYISHQKAMSFLKKIFMNYLSIHSVKKVTFWSVANNVRDKYINIYKEQLQMNPIDQTQLFGEILKICKPTILDTQCAVVPRHIPKECGQYIRVLHVGRNKHYEFEHFCDILKNLNTLETIYIALLMDYPTQEKISCISWPNTLENIYWTWHPTNKDDKLMSFFEKDVREKCPKLKIFSLFSCDYKHLIGLN
eukprot:152098_1